VRGRIDLLETERSHLLLRGKVACRFENLTVNTPRNRYVRAALTVVARIVHRRELAHRCRVLASSLERLGVSADVPTRAEMSTAHGRNDVDDQLMIAAARLAFDLVLPTETTGNRHLSLPSRNAVWVRKLYEKAVGGFYDVVLSPCGWRVRMGQAFEWQISHQTSRIAAILPTMRTDVVLLNDETGHRIVIDTKFNSILTRGWFRNDSLRSGYLYQMYAYLRSQIADGDPSSEQASGLLLHPSVGEMVDESVVIQGHAIRFGTVDLAASATAIRAQLLRLVQVSSIDPEGRHPPGGGEGG